MDAKKQNPQDWEDAIEKQIRAAIERGEFDNLRGKGKPLDLGINPHTPEDWRLAYKMMKDAGGAPDWIEAGKDIRADLQTLTTWFAKQAQWQRARLASARDLACAKFRERATALNKEIDLFNLKAPPGIPHFARVRIEEEIEKFQAACKQK